MNNMLNSIRSLAVHAANVGANDTSSIAADQTAVDKAVTSIQRIATTTEFAGKKLLDGSAGTVVTDQGTNFDSVISIGQVAASGQLDIEVTTAAEQATYENAAMNDSGGVFSNTGTITTWLETSGTAGTNMTYSIAVDQTTTASVAAMINSDSSSTGIWASSNGAGQLGIYSCAYGDHVKLRVVTQSIIASTATALNTSDAGVDIVASIENGGLDLDGSGLVIYGSSASEWSGTKIALASGQNTVATITDAVSIDVGSLQFALTDDASTSDLVTYAISDMRSSKIGVVANYAGSSLNEISSGETYNLSTNAAAAVQIIDDAVNDVANQRAQLGAFQKFTLESTINNLGSTKENLQASESRIRDVDMASEMMDFTKNQIMVQAGTAMLAQANQLPQSVLQLLQG
jgi:flagellin